MKSVKVRNRSITNAHQNGRINELSIGINIGDSFHDQVQVPIRESIYRGTLYEDLREQVSG